MSYSTRSSTRTDSDSENRYSTRQHRYNTRYSARNLSKNARESYTTQELNKPNFSNQCLPVSYRGRGEPLDEEDDQSSMDYCEPCATPRNRYNYGNIWSFVKAVFYILLVLTTLSIGFFQFLMNNEVKQLKEELHKIRGGHRKEDPHAKLSKELDKKCSDTLKLLLKDPVGRPDFALESSGGRVISVDSAPYMSPKTFLGFKICEGEHGPSSMIQATTFPGECWAFKGQSAKAIIQLIDEVLIDSVTLEHIPHTISPSGNIDTAPKEFKFWGLNYPKGTKKFLGQFVYDKDGSSVQTFHTIENSGYYNFVEFEVLSNHGNKEFTCVYRIRVHGTVRNSSN